MHDLRILPTANDPRPTFYWSAESPRDVPVGPGSMYPKLLWHRETHQEITVYSAQEERDKLDAYQPDYPPSVVVEPQDELAEALAALTDEERRLVLEAQQAARMDDLKQKLAALPADKLEALLSGALPEKRKPGRPKKAQVA